MPGKPDRPHRIRVRSRDGKPRDPGKLKGKLVPHVDVIDVQRSIEFVICAQSAKHLESVRVKLASAEVEEIAGGDTSVPNLAPRKAAAPRGRPLGAPGARDSQPSRGTPPPSQEAVRPLPGKPYGFAALPEKLASAAPVWHDGTCSQGRLSGEIRLELTTLTPLLVGWERAVAGDSEAEHPLPGALPDAGPIAKEKSVLCPLRAPWGPRPVIIPGDTLKGLLRHELGALLGAPMERVAERSYSYRPNALFAEDSPILISRLARIPAALDAVAEILLDGHHRARVPRRLELLPLDLKYDRRGQATSNYYRFDGPNGAPYRGGLGAGEPLGDRALHSSITAKPTTSQTVDVPEEVQRGFLATLRHLTDESCGHFSERHPEGKEHSERARQRILEAAASVVFQPGDLIWVEWDTDRNRIVSLGWHYYYRWAYTDTVRRRKWAAKEGGFERHGLFPLPGERAFADDTEGKHRAPQALSSVRRLFGYTSGESDEVDARIGSGDHAQLMGRVSVNAALEVVEEGDSEETRFLEPTFLKELGMPRPSAVEHYLQQPRYPQQRPADNARLMTYGDAEGYDRSGELAGRKLYLDRPDAHAGTPWQDGSAGNRENPRSTLALEASRPERRFRFTVRFVDLDPEELAAILVALCPHQFREALGGQHPDGYCSKLGYARPLGWGTVRIEAREMLFLDSASGTPALKAESHVLDWVTRNHRPSAPQAQWLALHRHKHPDAADYPREEDPRKGKQIYAFHTRLRAEHARDRRCRKRRRQ